jgi:hypothetical protein
MSLAGQLLALHVPRTEIVATFALAVFALCGCSDKPAPVTSPEAAVQSAQRAWRSIYEKTRAPVYSPAATEQFVPYTAVSANGVWTVRGTIPNHYRGEFLVTTVRQSDGGASVIVQQND